jgi:hypothetical protein
MIQKFSLNPICIVMLKYVLQHLELSVYLKHKMLQENTYCFVVSYITCLMNCNAVRYRGVPLYWWLHPPLGEYGVAVLGGFCVSRHRDTLVGN